MRVRPHMGITIMNIRKKAKMLVVSVPVRGLQSKVGAQKSIRSRVRPRMGITMIILTAKVQKWPRRVRPRVGITTYKNAVELTKNSHPSPHGDYPDIKMYFHDLGVTSVPVWGLHQRTIKRGSRRIVSVPAWGLSI